MKIKISSILIFISLIPLMIGDGIQYILKISSRNLAMLIAIEACIYFSIFLYSFCKRKTNWCINTIVLIYITIFISAGLHHVLNNALLNYIGGFAMCLIFVIGYGKNIVTF